MNTININLGEHDLGEAQLDEKVLALGYSHKQDSSWEIESPELFKVSTLLGQIFYATDSSSYANIYFINDILCGKLQLNKKIRVISSTIHGPDISTIEAYILKIQEILVPVPEPTLGNVRIKFWYNAPDGPRSNSRVISVPIWNQIQHNYEESTRDNLDKLMEFKPTKSGQLILWHGIPGTGKTYALRALCSAWKDWCSAEYILDPEALFGYSAAYLSSMLLNMEDEYSIGEEDDGDENKWKLLILEDTGEFLSETAKDKAGQGLSRLLNVSDGIIGQGLRVLILITTNEEITKIHPAVSRPGRCAAAIRFEPLGPKTIKEWGEFHKIEIPRKSEISLAELYELIGNKVISNRPREQKLGFILPHLEVVDT